VTTPCDLAPHPRPVPDDGELGLSALLELFVREDAEPTATRPSLRSSAVRVLGWTKDSSRRAARWGSVAGVSQ